MTDDIIDTMKIDFPCGEYDKQHIPSKRYPHTDALKRIDAMAASIVTASLGKVFPFQAFDIALRFEQEREELLRTAQKELEDLHMERERKEAARYVGLQNAAHKVKP